MPLLRFDAEPRRALYDLQADATRRPLLLLIKEVLIQLRAGGEAPPRTRAFLTIGGGHGYYTTVRFHDETWAVAWKRLEDDSIGVLYVGPDTL